MAICEWCEQEMKDHVSCITKTFEIDGVDYPRIPYEPDGDIDDEPLPDCHDCSCPPGGFHHPGCDAEECPKCGGQAISCGCGSDPDDED